ncbi:MAG: MetQ/NlpA family ABC transporter substrate-binding protein [Selenomonadaceae bacterium]|nr:MetQ/NlpA family ABC transporter substrate-binding protein [Selenomonadaceae bacterium]MBQ6132292.1 MetQ/NlpA family ABC transporter substrate-binding protein [Selenomonadaceae bacterium]
MRGKFFAALTLAATLLLTGCGGGDQPAQKADDKSAAKEVTLKIGATPVPHSELLEEIKPDLKEKGITLEIVEFNDYVQPNIALNDKELDANFFQHEPYLNDFIAEHKDVKLKNAGGIHIEPMGIYSKKIKDLKELADGATVSIPNDPTNGGRALLLLQKAGLLKLKDGVNEMATVQDIAENPKNLNVQEVEAAQLPRTLEDVDISIINTNFAMNADLNPMKDALFIEDKTSPYVNIIAVRDGDENRDDIKTLVNTLQSDKIKKFIEEKYKGAIVPAF